MSTYTPKVLPTFTDRSIESVKRGYLAVSLGRDPGPDCERCLARRYRHRSRHNADPIRRAVCP